MRTYYKVTPPPSKIKTKQKYQKTKQTKKQTNKRIYIYKMAVINLNSNSRHKFPTKTGKTTFPKEFFHKIWLIFGEYQLHC